MLQVQCIFFQIGEKGNYLLGQLCIKLNGLEFLKSLMKEQISFSVICDEPAIHVSPKSGKLHSLINVGFIKNGRGWC